MAEYVRDEFARTVAAGWGTADVGGAWTESLTGGAGAPVTSVASPVARVAFPSSTLAADAREQLAAASVLDSSGAIRFRASAVSTPHLVAVMPRNTGTLAAPVSYFIQAVLAPVAAPTTIRLDLGTFAAPTSLASITLPGLVPAANTWYQLEWEIVGAPTRIRARLFDTTAGTPDVADGWYQASNDTTGPQVAGPTTVRVNRPAPAVATASTVELEYLYISDPVAASFTGTSTHPPDGEVTFDSAASTGDIASRAWDFGDGTAAGAGTAPVHVYGGPGSYLVRLTVTTRWGAGYRRDQLVDAIYDFTPVSGGPFETLAPMIRLGGVDICDLVYSASWQLGRTSWTEAYGGQTASLRLRGAYSGDLMGKALVITARDSGAKLWMGWVDEVSVTRRPGPDGPGGIAETFVIAADSGSYLGKRHIEAGSTFYAKQLPGRLDDLNIDKLKSNRSKWPGVPATRWTSLRFKQSKADKLRDRTYLDMINDALTASIAFAFTDGAGRVTYAPWDAPAGVSSAPTVDFDDGLDCASAADVQRRAIQSLVNRWTVPGVGSNDDIDRVSRGSIEAYGERAHSVGADVLDPVSGHPNGDLPLSSGMFNAMAQPALAPVVTVPITDWDQASITLEPLDIALWSGTKFAVMGVRHEVSLSGWTMTAYLDRNPWATRGASPP